MAVATAPPPAPPNLSRLQDADTLRSQIAAGMVEVDARLGQFQRTLLHMAVMAFRPDLVEVLLQYDADPRLEDTEGHSALTLAVELRDSGLAGSADIVADPEGLVQRMQASVNLLEFQALAKDFMENGLSFGDVSTAVSAPAAPSQLLRLTSTGRPVKPPPASPLPPSLTRGVSIDGAASTTPLSDLAQALEVLDRRVQEGDQVFSDIGLWCVMQLHERSTGIFLNDLLPKRARGKGCTPCRDSEPCCGICLEPVEGLVTAPCGRNQCSGSFCSACLTTYVQNCVAEIRYALPLVRCPATECRRRIPTKVWADLLVEAGEASVQQRIQRAGEALLKIRCPSCHQPRDLFQCDMQGTGDATSFGESVVQGLETKQRLRLAKEVETFRMGGLAQNLLDLLESLDAPEEKEVARGVPPAKLEARFQGLCGVLSDPERAASLELAFYRRYPMIKTKCCRSAMCFKCKVSGHHPGETCEERQAKELAIDAQYCPGCGVPTVKSEGCDHIVCVCGSSWTWRRGG